MKANYVSTYVNRYSDFEICLLRKIRYKYHALYVYMCSVTVDLEKYNCKQRKLK